MRTTILTALLFCLGSIFFIGCATTNTTSFTDPNFKNKSFQKLCISADFSDLQYKQKLENELRSYFSKAGINVVTGTQVFPPTREWSEEAMQNSLQENSVDGFLLIVWKDKHITETYRPGQTVTETKGEVKKKNGKDVYTERTVTSQNTGSIEKNFQSFFEAKLIDVSSRNTAWIATSTSESGEWFGSDFNLIMESYAEDIFENLKKDGLVRVSK